MRRWLVVLEVVAGAALAGTARGQQAVEWDSRRVVATRDGLQQLKGRLQLAAQSTAYSPHLRALATAEAAEIDRRLADGDFRPGDRIYVQVVGEPTLTDTFSVGPARDITMQMIGAVPLTGVLRSDVQPYIKTYLGKFLRNPNVVARPLVSISVVGNVLHPGFYTVSPTLALTQVLSEAGGPTPAADLTQIIIERDGKITWQGAAVQRAIVEGRTVEQLGLRPGDRITLLGGETDFYKVFQTVSYGLGIPLAIFSIVQLFKGR